MIDVPTATKAAIEIQWQICQKLIREKVVDTAKIHLVAGADAAYTTNEVIAGITVMSVPQLKVECMSIAAEKVQFPYIPGLLAFREGPAVISAYEKLEQVPDVILFNGHGYAHPRRCGLASHLGILLDIPSIGVADKLMVGVSGTIGADRGSMAPVDDGNERIAMSVRTKENARPIYISIGHKVDLDQAVDLVIATTTRHRIPEPLWLTDQYVRKESKKGIIFMN